MQTTRRRFVAEAGLASGRTSCKKPRNVENPREEWLELVAGGVCVFGCKKRMRRYGHLAGTSQIFTVLSMLLLDITDLPSGAKATESTQAE